MLDMRLDAYTYAGLQVAAAILRDADSEGISLQELIKNIEMALPKPSRPVVRVPVNQQPAPSPPLKACPTFGCSGTLTVWRGASKEVGARVIGCVKCMYSIIEANQNG